MQADMTTLRESQSIPTKRCCESGRPIAIDPATGSTICSCQMQTGVPAYLSRVPRLPESFYGTMTGTHGNSEAVQAFYQSYPTSDRLVDGRSMPQTSGLVHSTAPYLGHAAMAAHPYGAFYPDYDLMAARRKNATRETTGPLKSWLYQHRKNPYPTKAEKVMLAIITQMTLTQVSTWFANARRRLKKENKLGKDVDLSDIDVDDKIEGETTNLNISLDSSVSDTSSTGNRDRLSSVISDISDAEDRSSPSAIPKKCVQRLFSPDGRDELYLERMSSPESEKAINKDTLCDIKPIETPPSTVNGLASHVAKDSTQSKPKIWSIADMLR